jgi:Ca-activated chloride channel family protein
MSRYIFTSANRSSIWTSILACSLVAVTVPGAYAQQAPATQPTPQQSTPQQTAPAPATPPAQQPGQQPDSQSPSGQAPAAQTPESPDSGGFKIVTSVNEVNLIFTVTDKHGNFIPNLKQSDFALLDDQKAPARVTSFTQQTNLPLRVGILIDASTSIRTRFQFEQQAAGEFLLQVVKSRSDRAFVMGFDSTPTVTQDWTNNLDGLQTGISKLRPGGGTALFDAVYTACRDKLLDISRGQEPVRRAMVLVTDGNDNQSRAYIDDAIKMCQRSETIIYGISTNWTPSRGKGDDVLMKLSEATGGRAFFPPSIEEMANSFNSIEEELRSQYALTYTPADFRADGAFRTIYLFCNDRRYSVRAKKGYFSPKQ